MELFHVDDVSLVNLEEKLTQKRLHMGNVYLDMENVLKLVDKFQFSPGVLSASQPPILSKGTLMEELSWNMSGLGLG